MSIFLTKVRFYEIMLKLKIIFAKVFEVSGFMNDNIDKNL